MKKLKTMPRFVKEIVITVCSYIILCLIWYYFIGENITLTDQGLSTIGLVLTTSVGSLTAIIVSFALIIWQTSRRDRNESFLRFRNTLHQLVKFNDINFKYFIEFQDDLSTLEMEASEAASVAPLNLDRYKILNSNIMNKLTDNIQKEQKITNPTNEQIEKARLKMYLMDYLVILAHANFDHNIAHNMYKGLLELRGLLYHLLCIFGICIILITINVTNIQENISDKLNIPLAIVLIVWVLLLLTRLGIRIKKFTHLEDEFLRQEKESMKK